MSRVSQESARGRGEAAEATRGSAIKLAAETTSRILTLGTTVLLARGLSVEDYGAYGTLSVVGVLLAEVAEFGLQALASRALVAGTSSLRSLARARAALFVSVAAGVVALAPLAPRLHVLARPLTPVLCLLFLYFALSAWGEFLGVGLRCRGARVQEALLLTCLRGGGLLLAGMALAVRAGLPGVAGALALSPLPALALGAWLLRRHGPAGVAPDTGAREVLRSAAPLAVHAGLLLLSPRVEFLVLTAVRDPRESALFFAAVQVFWFLAMVPSAVAAGAMPALTREAVGGGKAVRQRTAATMALLGAPAAVGLALIAPGVLAVFGDEYVRAAAWLQILAIALVPLFMNALLTWALIASGRSGLLPRLTAARVAAAFVLATVLVPRFGAAGAAVGLTCAETALLVLEARACAAGGFAVPVLRPVAFALAASVPMALAVHGVGPGLVAPVVMGALTYSATLAASWRLLPGLAREMIGDLRYP
jgi:O-antigen/teichoic acid export membrane protein